MFGVAVSYNEVNTQFSTGTIPRQPSLPFEAACVENGGRVQQAGNDEGRRRKGKTQYLKTNSARDSRFNVASLLYKM